jgi:ABC-type branched-subunit amino acid transport system substrate-binding protein
MNYESNRIYMIGVDLGRQIDKTIVFTIDHTAKEYKTRSQLEVTSQAQLLEYVLKAREKRNAMTIFASRVGSGQSFFDILTQAIEERGIICRIIDRDFDASDYKKVSKLS